MCTDIAMHAGIFVSTKTAIYSKSKAQCLGHSLHHIIVWPLHNLHSSHTMAVLQLVQVQWKRFWTRPLFLSTTGRTLFHHSPFLSCLFKCVTAPVYIVLQWTAQCQKNANANEFLWPNNCKAYYFFLSYSRWLDSSLYLRVAKRILKGLDGQVDAKFIYLYIPPLTKKYVANAMYPWWFTINFSTLRVRWFCDKQVYHLPCELSMRNINARSMIKTLAARLGELSLSVMYESQNAKHWND